MAMISINHKFTPQTLIFEYNPYHMNLKYQLFLVLIVVIGLTHSQEKDAIPIKIGYVEDVTLEAQQKQLFTISIDY